MSGQIDLECSVALHFSNLGIDPIERIRSAETLESWPVLCRGLELPKIGTSHGLHLPSVAARSSNRGIVPCQAPVHDREAIMTLVWLTVNETRAPDTVGVRQTVKVGLLRAVWTFRSRRCGCGRIPSV